MTYPIPNLSRIWVRGRIIDLGKAATDQSKYGVGQAVTFTPSAKVLINAETKQIIASSPFRVSVDETNGYFQILLPATDDPDVNPTGFTYAVSEPGTGRSYNIVLPISTPLLNAPGDPLHGQPVVELSDIVPAPGPSGGLVQLVSGRGIQSMDASTGTLIVTYTDGTTQDLGPISGGEGGTITPDATTTTKGKAVILGGTASAPTVPWTSVTGAPTIPTTKSDIGLSNVDNTSDAAKPVSTATQTALDGKVGTSDARLTDQRVPTDNSVTNAKVASAAAISADKLADGSTNKVLTATERTKLAGVATGATANATDAQLRDRATHTGSQLSTTISDFTEAVQDAVAALLGAGSNVILNYDDAANSLTISATGTGGTGLDAEQVRDTIGVALVGVGNVAVTVNDAADTITVSTTATANATDAQLRDRATHTGTQSADTLTDGSTNRLYTSTEKTKLSGVATGATANATDAQLRDRATHTGTQAASTITGLATVATSGAYADLSGTPSIPAAYTDEQAQDAVAAMIAAGTHSGISFSYNDAGNALSATASAAGDTVTDSTSVSGTLTISATTATKFMDYTANSGNVTLAVPTGTPANHQQIHVTMLASGAARDVTIHADISVMSGLTRVYTIPQNQVARFVLEYTSLGAKWRLNAFALSS